MQRIALGELLAGADIDDRLILAGAAVSVSATSRRLTTNRRPLSVRVAAGSA